MEKYRVIAFIAIIFAFGLLNAQTTEAPFRPLDKVMADRAKWDDDIGEVAYVGSRCSALFLTVGNYFISNGTKPSDKLSGEDLRSRSRVIMSASVVLGRLSKLEEQDTLNRVKVFLGLYAKKMADNKLLLNNALETPIEDDLNFCHQYEHNYVIIYQMYENEVEKSNRKK
jgi:hypothetical protein